MKELVIISGKGGTGKTSITAAFASLAHNHILCDADVDAADLHLLMNPETRETHDFMGGGIAEIRQEDCVSCGTCRDVCTFTAISEDFIVDPIGCEGCGVCVDFCPEKAIDFPPQKCGEWFISDTRFAPMVHARLGIAEENSGKLVSVIRQQAKKLAEEHARELLITDGPPGIGCPVIASITGATALLLVVEPTVSGLHDMQRVANLATHFSIPTMLCINKFDLNPEISASIEIDAAARDIRVIGRIPFDPTFTRAMIERQNIMEYNPESALAQKISELWDNIITSEQLNSGKKPEITLTTIKQ
ncbi:MAG: (4Fe-4S)-binding protein [Desulfobacterales bacterium]|nr:MAG: (4Fe-4S)-binding protein [Desulfobacterales bacterium]